MKRIALTLLLIACFIANTVLASPPKRKDQYVQISTSFGNCIIRLYNETPKHRDNFLTLTNKKVYDSLLFHRVIKGFMIQGGDPDSKKAKADDILGNGDVGYTIAAEFNPSFIHKKGALAAARDNNPQKASSGCQFYIVQGKVFTDEQLDAAEKKNGMKYTPEQRAIYKTVGGTPHLDNNYTVYGEVVEGFELVDKIAEVEKGSGDRPKTDVHMMVKQLSKKEVKRLNKRLKNAKK